jgi:hypothetical protein
MGVYRDKDGEWHMPPRDNPSGCVLEVFGPSPLLTGVARALAAGEAIRTECGGAIMDSRRILLCDFL